ncbi:MAG TPA: 3-phosphoshikimate 1-carboxyvinyltransferase [Pseudogracilibacillus sp.]|nr:3-phosphoshikimate 1-carboxyvinyltransferase [Pseudogracilibacillus sp.]
MRNRIFSPLKGSLNGEFKVPGDKSISHRAVMIGSLAKGQTTITNFLNGEDCLRTIKIFQQFGVDININNTDVVINSLGYGKFVEPNQPLYFGNSGTTARLMLGILAGLPFHTVVYGDKHLTERPMDRVVLPLKKMNAEINGRNNGLLLPLAIKGKQLKSIEYNIPVESAQVKSALIFASLFTQEASRFTEKSLTRDHTENMLNAFGANIKTSDLTINVVPKPKLIAKHIKVPGDISSAAFFLVAGALVPGSKITLLNVGLNESRTGILTVLEAMGANLSTTNIATENDEKSGDITVTYKELHGTVIEGDLIPKLIDEIPILALLATQAEGETVIKDAIEMRVKETDRIKAVYETLTTLGAEIRETEDGLIIKGNSILTGGSIKGYDDHRMAMMGIIASLITTEDVIIDNIDSINISYPSFIDDLNRLI